MKKNILQINGDINYLDEFAIESLKELKIDWINPIKDKTGLYTTLYEAIDQRGVLKNTPNLKNLLLALIILAGEFDDTEKSINQKKEDFRLRAITQALIDWNKRTWVDGNPQISFKFHIKKLIKQHSLSKESVKNIGGIESFRKDAAEKLNISKKTLDDWMNNNPKAQQIIETLRPAKLTTPLDQKKKNSLEIMALTLRKS